MNNKPFVDLFKAQSKPKIDCGLDKYIELCRAYNTGLQQMAHELATVQGLDVGKVNAALAKFKIDIARSWREQ